MIEQQIRDHLRTSTAIRDRVDKGSRNPGIYAGVVPASHRGEAIVLQDITGDRFYHLAGEAGIERSLVQITCYAASPAKAKSLSEAVRNMLSGYRGDAGDIEPTAIQSAVIDNEPGADQEEPLDSSDHWFFSYTVEYGIMHTTSIPTFT